MPPSDEKLQSWVQDIAFERTGPLRRLVKGAVVNPAANWLPAALLRWLLRVTKSELAAANWADPGGWRSMVVSYEGRPRQIADKVLVGGGTMAMALRNRKRLVSRILARLIEDASARPAHVLCLGAGPGCNIIEAMCEARADSIATLVDLSGEAFEYGRRLASERGLDGRVRFVQGDVRQVGGLLDRPPDIVKLVGICEYLADAQIGEVAGALAAVMPPGAPVVANSLSKAHGTDRFFRRVFGLHMAHRGVAELEKLLAPAGFAQFRSCAEPLGIYHVLVGRRQ